MKPLLRTGLGLCLLLGAALIVVACAKPQDQNAQASTPIYSDTLAAGWQNNSWGSSVNLAATGQNGTGISATINQAWAALYLRNEAGASTTGYDTLRFAIWGGATGQQNLRLKLEGADKKFLEPGVPVTAKANAWTQVDVPLIALGAPSTIYGIAWQEGTGASNVPIFALDDIALVRTSTPTPGGNPEPALTNRIKIYEDALGAGFASWSWSTNLNPNSSEQRHLGNTSLAAAFTAPWAGLYLHSDTALGNVNTLRFWLHGGPTGKQKIVVKLVDASGQFLEPGQSITASANTWTLHEFPFAQLGNPESISGVVWQDTAGAAQPGFYLDDISLHQVGPVVPLAPIALSVDSAPQHAISPGIYGISFASEALAKDLRLPLRRYGGNSVTRYNWRVENTNRGSDYFFLSSVFENEKPDVFVAQNKRTNTQSYFTIPTIGWVTKSSNATCGFSVAKYGPQQETEPNNPDCGNGKKPDGSDIVGNDPRDTSVPSTPADVGAFVSSLVAKYGNAANGGVATYVLDNEPGLWNSTHRDVHPEPLSYEELKTRTLEYARAIKSADPSAKTAGPAEWGWSNYFYSSKDFVNNAYSDRAAHGNQELTAWYLAELKKADDAGAGRLLDYLDLHYYPQAQNVFSDATDPATRALRLRSTRSLWDASYKDESWISQTTTEGIRLIPRMKDWVANNYPGTKVAVGEYNFGGLKDINGALAQADALGIFGRENADIAILWGMPEATDLDSIPGIQAFRMYRNYDGAGANFGSTSLKTTSSDHTKISIYAAKRNDGATTVMVVNKLETPRETSINFGTGSNATLYRYSAANLKTIVNEGKQALNAGKLNLTLPASSINLFVVR